MAIEQLMKDESFNVKLKKAESLEEVVELFREQEIDTSIEALKPLLTLESADCELDEIALESVAGGISGRWPWNSAQDQANLREIGLWLGYTIGRSIRSGGNGFSGGGGGGSR